MSRQGIRTTYRHPIHGPGLAALGLSIVLTACASAPLVRPTSSLELRQLQSRTYSDVAPTSLLKSALATFQDEGFTVRSADADLGFVSATRESFQPGTPKSLQAARWAGAAMSYGLALLIPVKKTVLTVVEGTAHVEELEKGEVRLRVSFQVRTLDERGVVLSVRDVQEAQVYQAFLAKVEKSVYLQKEHL